MILSRRLLFLTISFIALAAPVGATTSALNAEGEPRRASKDAYKKAHRNMVTAVAQGRAEEALASARLFLDDHPGDVEALYVKALALSQLDRTDEAMAAVKRAVDGGLPFGRFLAGPRALLAPLRETESFGAYARQQEVELIHGPMVGTILPWGARFWVRTASEIEVALRVSTSPDMDEPIVSRPVRTLREADFTVVVEMSGLEADTTYFYDLSLDGKRIAPDRLPSFRTAPERGAQAAFSIAFGGGAGYTPDNERMWTTILARAPRAFLFLGDNVYIDTPEVPATQSYCYYRRQSRPEFRAFAASTPIYAIWDDHDFGTNDCTGFADIDRPAWKKPVLDIFRQNWVNPGYGRGSAAPGCWFEFSLGNVDFFMLDCRFYRENPKKVAEPSMLGRTQLNWLLKGLRQSKAVFKVIASSVPWASGTKPGSLDTWDGFDHERQEIFSFIEKAGIDGVMLLSADRHRSDARTIEREGAYTLHDLMSSRLTNVHTHKLIPGALFGYNEMCSFGLLSFDTTLSDPEAVFEIVDIDGKTVHTLTLKRSALERSR